MPILKSAKKELRKGPRRRELNNKKKQALKRLIKEFRGQPSNQSLSVIYKTIDKAAKTNVIKSGTADRFKSRLSKLIKK